MTTTTANAGGILSPEQVGQLVIRPLIETAVATQVSTVVQTDSHDYRIPVVANDPAAQWVPEGSEITPSDQGITEVVVTPRKLAGLSIVSNELVDDSDPAALATVGQGLVRDLKRRLDVAFFAAATTNGPAGIDSATTSIVDTGGTITNLDSFAEALSIAEVANGVITSFAMNPADLLVLSKLKKETGSAEPLLAPDPSSPTKRQVQGVPLFSSPAVAPGVIWGIPSATTFVVIRKDYSVEADRSAYFSSDRTGIKAIVRVGFGFPHPAAIVKLWNAP